MAMDEKKDEKKEDHRDDERPEKKRRKDKNADLGIQIWIPKEMLADLDSVFDFMRHRMEDRPRISRVMHAMKTADAPAQGASAPPDAALGQTLTPVDTTGKVKAPRADIVDDGKAYIIRAEIPGVPKEKVDINVTTFQLEIKADVERDAEEKGKGYVRRERRHSSYFRSIPFPTAVVPDKAEAKMEHGILRIVVPKEDPGKAGRKKVEIK